MIGDNWFKRDNREEHIVQSTRLSTAIERNYLMIYDCSVGVRFHPRLTILQSLKKCVRSIPIAQTFVIHILYTEMELLRRIKRGEKNAFRVCDAFIEIRREILGALGWRNHLTRNRMMDQKFVPIYARRHSDYNQTCKTPGVAHKSVPFFFVSKKESFWLFTFSTRFFFFCPIFERFE